MSFKQSKKFVRCGVITFDLDDISHDPEFDENTRDLATKYLNVFSNKNFVIILHFITDILED